MYGQPAAREPAARVRARVPRITLPPCHPVYSVALFEEGYTACVRACAFVPGGWGGLRRCGAGRSWCCLCRGLTNMCPPLFAVPTRPPNTTTAAAVTHVHAYTCPRAPATAQRRRGRRERCRGQGPRRRPLAAGHPCGPNRRPASLAPRPCPGQLHSQPRPEVEGATLSILLVVLVSGHAPMSRMGHACGEAD